MKVRSATRLGLMCGAAVFWTTACGGAASTADQQSSESDAGFAAEAAGDTYNPLIDAGESCDRRAAVAPKPRDIGRPFDAGSAEAFRRDINAVDRRTDDVGDRRDPADAAPADEPDAASDAAFSDPQDAVLREPTGEKWIEGGCLGWPAVEFSPSMFAWPTAKLQVGDTAPKFALLDHTGLPHTLDGILAKGPVVLIPVSLTCNIFRPQEDGILALAKKYAGKVQFVLVYVIEAHPMEPDVSPYTGEIWTNEYSTVNQPPTLGDRIGLAKKLDSANELLVLVDDLNANAANPFWCSYGTLPFGAFAVDVQGIVRAVDVMSKGDGIEQAALSLVPQP